jgi:hypothetical protein
MLGAMSITLYRSSRGSRSSIDKTLAKPGDFCQPRGSVPRDQRSMFVGNSMSRVSGGTFFSSRMKDFQIRKRETWRNGAGCGGEGGGAKSSSASSDEQPEKTSFFFSEMRMDKPPLSLYYCIFLDLASRSLASRIVPLSMLRIAHQ